MLKWQVYHGESTPTLVAVVAVVSLVDSDYSWLCVWPHRNQEELALPNLPWREDAGGEGGRRGEGRTEERERGRDRWRKGERQETQGEIEGEKERGTNFAGGYNYSVCISHSFRGLSSDEGL